MQSGYGNREPGPSAGRRSCGVSVAPVLFMAVFLASSSALSRPSARTFQTRTFQTKTSNDTTSLQDILAGMDKAAADFTSLEGDLEYTKVTVVVNDRSTQRGKIYFEKSGGKPGSKSGEATRVMIAFFEPAEKYVLFANDKVDFYQPKIAEVDEYQLSQKQDLVEQFLLLGFGTPGSELRRAYQVSLRGEENLDGQQAFLLELIPKSAKVAAQLERIDLWISRQNWQPIQQKFYEPGGDYLIARYTGLKWNAKIPGKNFRLPLKGKVRTVTP